MANRKLDKYGLQVYHNAVKTECVTATHDGASVTWTGSLDASALITGKQILYTLTNGNVAGQTTLELTFPGGTTTGPIGLRTTFGETTIPVYPPGSRIYLLYDGTYWVIMQYVIAITNSDIDDATHTSV